MATSPAAHPFSLAGRVALVTGGAQGLGLAMASALADAGAHVLVCARNAQRVADAVSQLQAQGATAEALVLDITDDAAVAQAFDGIAARHGRLDILVNNAGARNRNSMAHLDADDLRAMLDTNLVAPYALCRHAARLMQQIGVQHVGVADTIGVGTPIKVQRAMEAALKHYPIEEVSGHFHDTYGQALANTLAALQMGVWNFQTSVAGLGGCPYAPGASGNVVTEDLVFMFEAMGVHTGIDLERLFAARAALQADRKSTRLNSSH